MSHGSRVALMLLFSVCACIKSKDECVVDRVAHDTLNAVPPGGMTQTSLTGCSTCDHVFANAVWATPAIGEMATGNIKLEIDPSCFLAPLIVDKDVNDSLVAGDTNYRNCSDTVDYFASAKNESNVTVAFINIELKCASVPVE